MNLSCLYDQSFICLFFLFFTFHLLMFFDCLLLYISCLSNIFTDLDTELLVRKSLIYHGAKPGDGSV